MDQSCKTLLLTQSKAKRFFQRYCEHRSDIKATLLTQSKVLFSAFREHNMNGKTIKLKELYVVKQIRISKHTSILRQPVGSENKLYQTS